MQHDELAQFINSWLKDWTGNDPEQLLSYYSNDALYIDPANRDGLQGHDSILPYFKKLLGANPDWVWTLKEIFPTEKGATFKWYAKIPVGDSVIEETGLDILEIESGKITRNEVYFDRTKLLSALRKLKENK
ncbi:MAG: nuclear transport factor 2 family protein [Candidatus Thorarchaeota archaeon]